MAEQWAPSGVSAQVLGSDADEHVGAPLEHPGGQHVHRRRADELGDEHRRRPVVHLLRRADLLQLCPRYITAIREPIVIAST